MLIVYFGLQHDACKTARPAGPSATAVILYKCKKLNSLKHLVRTTVAGSHN